MTNGSPDLGWSATWNDRRVTVTLRQADEVTFVDRCEVTSELARERLLQRLKNQVPAADVGPIRSKLLAMAAEGPPKQPAAARFAVPPIPEPWDAEVAGDCLLEEILAIVKRHVVLDEHAAHAVVLWVVHTYVFDRFHYSPRLLVSSPEKRCGKSLLLRLVAALSARALICESISSAALYRTVEKFRPTLILDEADTYLAGRNVDEDLRGILNAGFESGGCVLRCVGDASEPTPFSVFGPLALGMIGKPPGTVEDRSIVIPMRRKLKGESVAAVVPGVPLREVLNETQRRIVRWALDHADQLAAEMPRLPPQLDDRSADCWVVLTAIADAVGGAWPERGRRAAIEMAKARDSVDSVGLMLLADLRGVFRERGVKRLKTQAALHALVQMEHRPWLDLRGGKPIDARLLAKQLEPFGVAPTKWTSEDDGTERGYRAEDLADAWLRYLPDPGGGTELAEQPRSGLGAVANTGGADIASTPRPSGGPRMAGAGGNMADVGSAVNPCEAEGWRQMADPGVAEPRCSGSVRAPWIGSAI